MTETPAERESYRALKRVQGSMPWWETIEKQRCRAKIFRSGNSIAVRIPAGTKLAAGMEMDLTIEDGQFLTLEPVETPKRKFNIAKVAGSARDLRPIRDEDRVFEPRSLNWSDRTGREGEGD